MRFILIAILALAFTACGEQKQNKRTRENPELTLIKKRIAYLELMSAIFEDAAERPAFSNCETETNPLVRAICSISQNATTDQVSKVQHSLGTMANKLRDATYGPECTPTYDHVNHEVTWPAGEETNCPKAGSLQARLEAIEDFDVGDIAADVSALQTQLGALSSDVATLQSQMVALENRIEDTEDRLDEAEDRLTDAEGRLNDLEDSMNDVQDAIADIQSEIVLINGQIDLIVDTLIADLDTRVDALEVAITAINSRLDDLEDRASDVEDRLDDLETSIDPNLLVRPIELCGTIAGAGPVYETVQMTLSNLKLYAVQGGGQSKLGLLRTAASFTAPADGQSLQNTNAQRLNISTQIGSQTCNAIVLRRHNGGQGLQICWHASNWNHSHSNLINLYNQPGRPSITCVGDVVGSY